MNESSKTPLVIAFVVVVVLFLIFGGGAMTGCCLRLPCNVIVYEQDGRSVVSAVDAARMLSVAGNPKLQSTASQVNEKLRRVIDNL